MSARQQHKHIYAYLVWVVCPSTAPSTSPITHTHTPFFTCDEFPSSFRHRKTQEDSRSNGDVLPPCVRVCFPPNPNFLLGRAQPVPKLGSDTTTGTRAPHAVAKIERRISAKIINLEGAQSSLLNIHTTNASLPAQLANGGKQEHLMSLFQQQRGLCVVIQRQQ